MMAMYQATIRTVNDAYNCLILEEFMHHKIKVEMNQSIGNKLM